MQKFSVSTRLLMGAGIAAAVCWTAADMLLVGFVQPPQPETLFAPELAAGLGDDADMAALMLTASPQRLLWGVLPATFSAVLYLVSVFGVWRLMRPSWAARFCCAMLFAMQTLRGQTVLSRKSAGCNPLPVGIFIALGCALFPHAEWAAMMGGATLNLAQLVFFVSAYRAVGK